MVEAISCFPWPSWLSENLKPAVSTQNASAGHNFKVPGSSAASLGGKVCCGHVFTWFLHTAEAGSRLMSLSPKSWLLFLGWGQFIPTLECHLKGFLLISQGDIGNSFSGTPWTCLVTTMFQITFGSWCSNESVSVWLLPCLSLFA